VRALNCILFVVEAVLMNILRASLLPICPNFGSELLMKDIISESQLVLDERRPQFTVVA
jgi:hypothetical protein